MRLASKNYYWQVVAGCLIQIHHLPYERAWELCNDLRQEVEARKTAMARDLFYHHEPFEIACDLAERPLDQSEYRERYERIQELHRPALR